MLLEIEGFLYRSNIDYRLGITGAWLAAAWSRSKRMPPLRQVLNQADGKKAEIVYQSKDEAKADMDKLAGDLGAGLPTLD